MPKFRKKPVVIEAMRYDGENADEVVKWAQRDWTKGGMWVRQVTYDQRQVRYHLVIPTLEGDHDARPGDWIIQGVKGELYPCKPDIFEATYEAAE